MDATIVIEQYPLWYIGFCLLAGFLYAITLYYKDQTFKEATKNERRWIWPLAFFRFLTVSTIAFLLLSPLLKSRLIDTIKPYIIFIQDDSESIVNGFAGKNSKDYENNINTVVSSLSENYNVKTYSFGSKLQEGFNFKFKDKVTNISNSLEEIYNTYTNQNVGAIVLATDGIFNQGSNPLYMTSQLDVPIFGVALGDTTAQKDLIVDKVLHNKIAYLDDKFTIRVDISAKNAKGSATVLNVYKGKGTTNKVYTKKIDIDKKEFIATQDVILDANAPGLQQYVIQVTNIKDEVTTQNNRQDIFVEILDNRQRILVLAASPHPDVSALRKAMELNKNYEISVQFAKDFKGSVKNYNLAILHGLPSAKHKVDDLISQLKGSSIPIWYIVSTQTDIAALNKVQSLIQINGNSSSTNDAKALKAGNFNLFTFDDNILQALEDLPPLTVPFGEFKASPTTQTLLKQKIGSVKTDYPLLVLEEAKGQKGAIFCGEGLWRWRLYDYQKDQSHQATNELVSKVMQYLSVKNDKRKFRVNVAKSLFNENEKITFDAELYNDSYELINSPEVNLTIYNSANKAFPFVFSKTSNAYSLNAGFFPVGNYTFKASTTFSGQQYSARGTFSVAPIQLENLQLTANHNLLYSLTEKNSGEVIYPKDITKLTALVQNNADIRPTQYSTYETKDIINLRWIFGILIALLTVEWFIRKFIGGY